MSKALKLERLINIILMLAFILAGFIPLISHTVNGSQVVSSCYDEILHDSDLYIYGNVFLTVPFFCADVIVFINLIEIIFKLNKPAVSYTAFAFYLLHFIFGVMFSAIASQMFPFGTIVLSIDLLLLINYIVFHYGIKKQVV